MILIIIKTLPHKFNMMTWKLTLIHNYQNSNEYCLTMTHLKRNSTLRQWYGPIARQLFKKASYKHNSFSSVENQHSILMDKQATQYFLIEASFFHQKCVQLFQINNDVKAKCLSLTQEVSELLLYIRMTDQHPSHKNLIIFADCHIPCHLDFENTLKSLLEVRLIQKIEILHFVFYDKNPYPHDHIFDHKSLTLKDHNQIEQLLNHQKLINHQATT